MIESRRSPAAAGELPRAVLQPGREVALDTGYSAAESLLAAPDSRVHFPDPRHPDRTRGREGARQKERGRKAGGGVLASEGGAARSLLRQDARKCCGVCSIP